LNAPLIGINCLTIPVGLSLEHQAGNKKLKKEKKKKAQLLQSNAANKLG
jgi:hypothetical protein